MNTELVQISALVKGYRSMADKTLRLTIDLNEMPQETLSKVISFAGDFCWLILAKNKQEEIFVPDVTPQKNGEFTPSQRLKHVLYREWEQKGEFVEFDLFYKNRMAQIIESAKERLK